MPETATTPYAPRFLRLYRDEVLPALCRQFGYGNRLEAPRLEKIVVNMGVGEGARDAKVLQRAEEDLALITGQKPKRTRARVSVSAFKIRAGMPVGCCVTLRGKRMYEFLERLIATAIPRIRDFRGLPAKAFDGRGNYSFGLREHLIFLELDLSKEMVQLGMDITIATTARTDEECRALLKGFGLPLRETERN